MADVFEMDALSVPAMRAIMMQTHGGSDEDGTWTWRDAYDAAEAGVLSALKRKHSVGADGPLTLRVSEDISSSLPTQTRRSEDQIRLQQFSTPLPLALCVATSAAIEPGHWVLEPSAGCGALAYLAQLSGGQVVANEINTRRADLSSFVLDQTVLRVDAEFIANHELPGPQNGLFDRVVMNPPFSSSSVRDGDPTIALRHVLSALRYLAPGGRLVSILPDGAFGVRQRSWMSKILAQSAVAANILIPKSAFAKSGTSFQTRLLVLDKSGLTSALGEPQTPEDMTKLYRLTSSLPSASATTSTKPEPTLGVKTPAKAKMVLPGRRSTLKGSVASSTPASAVAQVRFQPRDVQTGQGAGVNPRDIELQTNSKSCSSAARGKEFEYDKAWTHSKSLSDSFAAYRCQRIAIDGAQPHPSSLAESIAMSSVLPPLPKPDHELNIQLAAQTVSEGLMSEAQLETAIMAEKSFSEDLAGRWIVDEHGQLERNDDHPDAKVYRRGYFLGDGAGCGKGRQIAGMILAGWLNGRRKAVWVSKSAALIEDARRDWADLGGAAHDIIELSKIKADTAIPAQAGILFVTYATLRSQSKKGTRRLDQILSWLGDGFDGVLAFDEAHAMANAAGKSDGPRGKQAGSQQGRAGLELQLGLPRARVTFVSATGATEVANLAYASRLGLWGAGPEYPFSSREGFVAAMEAGGVAAMEVVARDLKALGLYNARALSFEGGEYDVLTHELTENQVAHYDKYCEAFRIIHANLHAALEATGINDPAADNKGAKSAAMSTFESCKQRFFNHLLQGLKAPAIIEAIKADVDEGWAPVVQIVSTGEALLNRRIETLGPDTELSETMLTPREYILSYIENAFPVQQHQLVETEEGTMVSKPVVGPDGTPMICREAEQMREDLMTDLMLLPPVPSFLDQLIWSLGTEQVAEITGRSKRPVRLDDGSLKIERRGATANTAETQAFMSGRKPVLVFTDAGGTGRSYHADPRVTNRARRRHYLVEPGWRADNAIQGLGRTHRAGQVSAPFVRVCTSDVHGEKRFTSTIARRLDTLGALTKGQRDTASQGLFRPEDNLESAIARSALRSIYFDLVAGRVEAMPYELFSEWTGLKLLSKEGQMLDELPPIQRFLNRLLALPISFQNVLFAVFMDKIAAITEQARQAGTLDVGLETLRADIIELGAAKTLRTCDVTGAVSRLVSVTTKNRNHWLSADEACDQYPSYRMMHSQTRNEVSLVAGSTTVVYTDSGDFLDEYRVVGPKRSRHVSIAAFERADYIEIDASTFTRLWDEQVAQLPEWQESEFFLLTGMLIPLWRELPNELTRVYRCPQDNGPDLLGRVLSKEQAFGLSQKLNPSVPASHVEQIEHALNGSSPIDLGQRLSLKRSRVAGEYRLEILGADRTQMDRIKFLGGFTEIIAYQLRVFIPASEPTQAADILKKLLV
jgi:predicted RNA methylase